MLSGRDLRAGGTWLGVNHAGRVAFLTNITEEYATYASSRGELARDFLLPDRGPTERLAAHVAHVVRDGRAYAGFNLLLLAPRAGPPGLAYDAAYVTNHGGGGRVAARPLSDDERRCGGLSNGVDGAGADAWPKVRTGSALFLRVLQAAAAPETSEDALAERLFELLTWRSDSPPRARAELRNTIQIEPLPIQGTLYGTRLSTVVLVRRDGAATFYERDVWVLDARGQPTRGDPAAQRVFHFRVDTAEADAAQGD